MLRTDFSSASMSVSSSHGFTSSVTTDYQSHTQSSNTLTEKESAHLGDGLGLSGLLSVVGSDTLGLDALSLSVLLIVGAEEVDIVVILLLVIGASPTF